MGTIKLVVSAAMVQHIQYIFLSCLLGTHINVNTFFVSHNQRHTKEKALKK